jgi:hypothetical protein
LAKPKYALVHTLKLPEKEFILKTDFPAFGLISSIIAIHAVPQALQIINAVRQVLQGRMAKSFRSSLSLSVSGGLLECAAFSVLSMKKKTLRWVLFW